MSLSYEIIVVDNHSDDNAESILKEIYPNLIWIQMDYNSGFARANNRGIKEAIGDYILLLNSDIILKDKNILFECVEFLQSMDNNKETILGIRLVDENNGFQETLRLEFPGLKKLIRANPLYILLFDRWFKLNKNKKEKDEQISAHKESGKVAWINAAFLLMHRETLLEKKLFFDEDFFLYGEDIEWCRRAKKNKMKFYHWHEKQAIHIGSASMPNDFLKRCQLLVSEWLMVRKTKGRAYLLLFAKMEIINLIADDIFHFWAWLRNKSLNDNIRKEARFRKIQWYLIYKYFFLILFYRKLSTETTFYTNCYEDPFLKRKS